MRIEINQIDHEKLTLADGRLVVRMNMVEFLDICAEDVIETGTHYVVTCPCCAEEKRLSGNPSYNKKKLYIPFDNPEQGMCQRCKTIFFHSSTDLVFDVIYKPSKTTKFQLDKLPNIQGDNYSLAGYFNRTTNYDELKEALIKRRSFRVLPYLEKFGIRGDKNSIIFPFKFGNEVIYWQERFFNPVGPKYFMPPIGHKPCYIPEKRGRDIIIVEGIFDALACYILFPDLTPVALLGSYITDYHIWLLRNYIAPRHALIYMDEFSISQGILMKLNGKLPTCVKTEIKRPFGDTDPDEFLHSLTPSELKSFNEVNRYEHYFSF